MSGNRAGRLRARCEICAWTASGLTIYGRAAGHTLDSGHLTTIEGVGLEVVGNRAEEPSPDVLDAHPGNVTLRALPVPGPTSSRVAAPATGSEPAGAVDW